MRKKGDIQSIKRPWRRGQDADENEVRNSVFRENEDWTKSSRKMKENNDYLS